MLPTQHILTRRLIRPGLPGVYRVACARGLRYNSSLEAGEDNTGHISVDTKQGVLFFNSKTPSLSSLRNVSLSKNIQISTPLDYNGFSAYRF